MVKINFYILFLYTFYQPFSYAADKDGIREEDLSSPRISIVSAEKENIGDDNDESRRNRRVSAFTPVKKTTSAMPPKAPKTAKVRTRAEERDLSVGSPYFAALKENQLIKQSITPFRPIPSNEPNEVRSASPVTSKEANPPVEAPAPKKKIVLPPPPPPFFSLEPSIIKPFINELRSLERTASISVSRFASPSVRTE